MKRGLVWSDVPDPVVKEDEMRIEIHAAALNRADLLQRQGKYPSPPGCPEWMGLEISGRVVELGGTAERESSWKIGDEVCALLGGGAPDSRKTRRRTWEKEFCGAFIAVYCRCGEGAHAV